MRESNIKHYTKTMKHYGLHLQPNAGRHAKKRVYVKDGVSWQIIADVLCWKDRATSFSVRVKKKEGAPASDDLEEKYYFKIARFVREELLVSLGAEHEEH